MAELAKVDEPLNPADDARNDVAAAIAQLKGAAEPAAPEIAEEPPEVEVTDAAVDAAPEAKADHPTDPNRYSDGTYKTKKADAAPVEAAPAKEIPSTDATKASAAVSTPSVAPPVGWTAAEKAEWSKLSPVAQAAVSRREAEISRGGQQWSEEKRRYEASIAPISQLARSRGMEVPQAAQLLAAAQTMLDQDPAEGVRRIAASYGVDLVALAQSPPAPQAPRVEQAVPHQFVDKVSTLESRLDSFLQNQTLGVVESFAQDKSHPYYADVESDIARLIPLVQQSEPHLKPNEVLQKAYDQAIYLNPQVRERLIAEQISKADTDRKSALQAKAASAGKAAVSIKGSSNGVMPPPKQANGSGDVYDDVRAAIATLREH